MPKFIDSIFGPAIQTNSFEALIALGLDPLPLSAGVARMWRGQDNIKWPLHSAAYRRLARTSKSVGEGDMRFYETSLLGRATHKGFRNIGGRDISDFDLLARLQHHGAATRLVDFTRNMLTALWFAVATEPKATGVLIGFHTHHIGGYEQESETRSYKEVVAGLTDHNHPQTWEPPSVTARIAAQHSQFLYSDVVDAPRGSLKFPEDPAAVTLIAVTPKQKERFSLILSQVFDIRHGTLFPDIDGFSQGNSLRFDRSSDYRW